ncbi:MULTISPECIES: hypothetical protein [Nonlabens]|uniref:Uncharacterized protein n=1 Tax=Nonlabens agnitus TaxID=870484 RepID=A0A2S9WSJ5_9FLAO|nr:MULTISPECIES: hypothetical protein [Nonlabens]KQC33588.1 hypothetical protein AAU57_09855 [Nonlabens sp. YIK11]PRP66464.1 hypothetical protein BST86_04835 [Nonlabens agnitus]
MKFMDEADNFRYVLWFLTILFSFLVFFGPSEGTLGRTGRLLLGLFASLLVIYLILKVIQRRYYSDKETEEIQS